MSDMRIVVAGGGLAGMTLAHHLHRCGIDVTVFEGDSGVASRDPGYRLHINSTGTAALHSALEPDLWELFLATSGMPSPEMPIFDEHMHLRPRRDATATEGVGAVAGVPEHLVVSRSTLRRVLTLGMQESVQFGVRVTGYDSHPDATVTVHLDDGRSVPADLLVGADGISSAVRAQRLPQVRVVDLESRHVTAKVPLDDRTRALLPPEMFTTFSLAYDSDHTGLTFGPLERSNPASPLVTEQDQAFQDDVAEDFALSIFNSTTSLMIPDRDLFTMGPQRLRAYVLERLSGWHPRLVEIVRHWDTATVQPLTLRSCVPVEAWAPSNVTVIGDAIHAMSSSLGIGANTALWDANVLAGQLISAARGDQGLVEAVGAYEEAMRDYGYDALRRSAHVGKYVIGHKDLPE